jgi:hypothetical protein
MPPATRPYHQAAYTENTGRPRPCWRVLLVDHLDTLVEPGGDGCSAGRSSGQARARRTPGRVLMRTRVLRDGSHSVTTRCSAPPRCHTSDERKSHASEAAGIMTTGEPGDQHLAEMMERALELAEETLEQVTRIAVEQIRKGIATSNHVEAAEREMRSALRQLVLAQGEWHIKPGPRVRLGEHNDSVADRGQIAHRED